MIFNWNFNENDEELIDSKNLVEVKTRVVKKIFFFKSKSSDFEEHYLSPWKVLQSYLESYFQLGIVYEMMGEGDEAEYNLSLGKNISNSLNFPMFMVAFSSLIGKIAVKSGDSDETAEVELLYAQKILNDSNRKAFCCSRCKSMFDVTLQEYFGDLIQVQILPYLEKSYVEAAKERYKRARELLNTSVWEKLLSCTEDDDSHATAGDKTCSCCIRNEAYGSLKNSIKAEPKTNTMAKRKRKRKTKNGIGCRSRISSSCAIARVLPITRCWHCLPSEVMKSGSMNDLVNLKWEFVRRQLSSGIQSRLVKCFAYANQIDEARKVLLNGVYNLVGRNSFSHTYTSIPKDFIHLLVAVEIRGDIFAIERAKLIFDICWYCLRYYRSEFTRKLFCNLAPVSFEDLVSWLTVAFVLSREVPEVFQKVSKLLSVMYVVSSSSKEVSLSSFRKDLGENYWSSYFHQASIGTHLTHKFHSRLTERFKGQCDTRYSSIREDTFNSLGLVPKVTKDLKKHVEKFLVGHSTTTVISMTLLGPDYAAFLRELPLPYSPHTGVQAWMLVSRLCFDTEPVVMLFPLDSMPKDEVDLSKYDRPEEDWCCPWGGFTVLDDIAPTFRALLEENDIAFSLVKEKRWGLDERFAELLRNLEDLWFGPWKCMLLGEWLNSKKLDRVLENLVNYLSECNLDVNKDLLKIIMGGSESGCERKALVSQLCSLKDCYIAKVGYVDKAVSGIFPNAADKDAYEDAFKQLEKALNELEADDSINRKPVILVLDSEVQMLPWESFPILRREEIYRMPSVSSIFAVLDEGSFPSIDPLNAFYLINPDKDSKILNNTERFFKAQNLEGMARCVPDIRVLASELESHDLFLYFGHSCGAQFVPPFMMKELEKCPVGVLMGCCSGAYELEGCYRPTCTPPIYLLAGSPAVVANLWSVTDAEEHIFGTTMFEAWKEKSGELTDRSRIGALMPQAREALPFLMGAGVVCFGVPTVICKKKNVESPESSKRRKSNS